MLELPEYATKRIGENVGSYARDEVEVLAHPADLQSLRDESAALQARIDALDARIDALATQLPAERAGA
jgi:ubiquinone biosynthesis protein UbiJ